MSAARLRELASTTLDGIKLQRVKKLTALIEVRQVELERRRRRPITNFFRRMLMLPPLPEPVVDWYEAAEDVVHPLDRRDTDSFGRMCASIKLDDAVQFAKHDHDVATKLLRAANLATDIVVVSVDDVARLWTASELEPFRTKTDA